MTVFSARFLIKIAIVNKFENIEKIGKNQKNGRPYRMIISYYKKCQQFMRQLFEISTYEKNKASSARANHIP